MPPSTSPMRRSCSWATAMSRSRSRSTAMRSKAGWPWAVPSSGSPAAGCSTRARSDSRATAILAPPGSCSTSSGGLLRCTALHTRSRRRRARCSSADCHRHSRLDSSVANKEERGWFGMAELTNLESKLGEVIGLAMAAQGATQKVSKLDDLDGDLEQELKRMQSEAKAAEERATEVAGSFEGKKTAILEEAREVKQKATEMMQDYLDRASDALDGFEFLTMAEAGEVGHWEILKTLNERARNGGVQDLVEWGIPIQQRHLETVRQGSLKLASEEDPNETS